MGLPIYGIIYVTKDRLILKMKKNGILKAAISFLAISVICPMANAQYYYKDLVSNKQLLADMARLKEQKIRTVSVKSFEDDGSPSEGFFCEKNISRNYSTVETMTKSNVTGPSLFISYFDKNGSLLKTVDSSEISSSTSQYSYDDKGNIISIRSSARSSDDDFANEIVEEHLYEYNAKGLPVKMTRVKNFIDSSTVFFSADEKNNVSIEKDTKSGSTYYYYYDNRNQLTDVVHFNQFNQKMLPDYVFEYNGAGLITQMTTTEEGGSYYYIWKYTYENGLRTIEKCFSKEKRLMGTIQYEYK
jgi:YD repeat-containing protein